jgi:glyoxylase-like metal-dependent hydrolase (beta-lactamase superfamily II)
MELAIFHCGGAWVPEALLIQGRPWRRVFLPLLGFALRHPTHGVILVDAPLGTKGLTVFSKPVQTFMGVGLDFRPEYALRARVEALGWGAPKLGVFTHLHFDHVGGIDDFPEVRWHPDAGDWARAERMSGTRASLQGYGEGSWLTRGRNVSPVTHTGAALGELGPTHDLLGDGTVQLVSLPGHAPGHQGVYAKLGSGREVLLCGDAAFDAAHLDGAELGFMPRRFAERKPQVFQTLDKLRAFHRARPGVTILPSHDLAIGHQVLKNSINFLKKGN